MKIDITQINYGSATFMYQGTGSRLIFTSLVYYHANHIVDYSLIGFL